MNNVKLLQGNCLEVLKTLPDNSIDSVVCDPPYGISFMNKKWDYDVPSVEVWKECLRVLKPGGHMLVACGTRTQHRMVAPIEDAGFEIRDVITWLYGCLSEDTEILTAQGWKLYHKDIEQDTILCYNVVKNEFEFHKPTASFYYPNEHTAYRIESDLTDQIVSHNHRCLVEREGNFIFKQAETLELQEDVPFLESLHDLPDSIYDFHQGTSITKQSLLSRVQDESDTERQKASQSDTLNESDLPNLQEGFSDKEKSTGVFLFEGMQWDGERARVGFARAQGALGLDGIESSNLSTEYDRRKESRVEGRSDLQVQQGELSRTEIHSLSCSIPANGTEGRLRNGTSDCYGSSFEQSVIQNGNSSSYRPQHKEQCDRKSNSVQGQLGTQSIRRTRAKVTPVEYIGNVWCVTVSPGAFVARRNGKIFITGNSGFPKSQNISIAIDKSVGVLGHRGKAFQTAGAGDRIDIQNTTGAHAFDKHIPITDAAKQWEGWGSALKPATEHFTLARKNGINCTIFQEITETLCKSIFNVLLVDQSLSSNNQELNEVLNTARCNAGNNTNTLEDLSGLMDTLRSKLTENSFLNIVSLWKLILDASLQGMNMFTTSTALNLTTDLKILKFYLSPTMQKNTHDQEQNGQSFNVSFVEALLVSVIIKLKGIANTDVQCAVRQDMVSLQDKLRENLDSEFFTLCRKPLSESTVAKNVLKHGTGGINVDGCRVEYLSELDKASATPQGKCTSQGLVGDNGKDRNTFERPELKGRFPANLILDEEAAAALDEQTTHLHASGNKKKGTATKESSMFGIGLGGYGQSTDYGDFGGASRFFYCAKSSKSDRESGLEHFDLKVTTDGRTKSIDNAFNRGETERKNNHPTVKPTKLMEYLCKLITPPGGTVLDPFMGSGSTGVGALREGFKFIGIELSEEYFEICKARLGVQIAPPVKELDSKQLAELELELFA